jgi:diacylglycerol kinase family enzyme
VECQVDVGEVNGRIFLNNSSLGVYPAIVRMRERYRATVGGKWLAALWAALTVMRRNPFMAVRIVVEEQKVVRRTPLLLVANNEYRASGIQAGTRESLAGGRLALYVLNAERRPGLLRLAWEVLWKEDATIETRRRHLHVAMDGEVFTLESPLDYRVRPGALRVLVPPAATACYPHPSG